MESDLTELSKEELIHKIETLYHNIDVLDKLYEQEKEKVIELKKIIDKQESNYDKMLARQNYDWEERTKELERKIKIKEADIDIFMRKVNKAWEYKIKAKIEEYEHKRDKAPITSIEYDIYICIMECLQLLLEDKE